MFLPDVLSDASLDSKNVKHKSKEKVTIGKHMNETRNLAMMFMVLHTVSQMRGCEYVE